MNYLRTACSNVASTALAGAGVSISAGETWDYTWVWK